MSAERTALSDHACDQAVNEAMSIATAAVPNADEATVRLLRLAFALAFWRGNEAATSSIARELKR